MLNDTAADSAAGSVRDFSFSVAEIKKVPPKNSFGQLREIADEKRAKRDRHSIGGIHHALETEIQKRNA